MHGDSTGHGPTDPSGPNDTASSGKLREEQRTLRLHKEAHASRIKRLDEESERYVRFQEAQIALLEEACERERRDEAENGEAPSDAQVGLALFNG
jgi:hypothetical protein